MTVVMEKKIKDLVKKEIKEIEAQIEERKYEWRDTSILDHWKRELEKFQTLDTIEDMKSWVKISQKEVKVGRQRVEDNRSPFHFGEEFDDAYDEMYFANSIISLENAVDTVLRACGEAYIGGTDNEG